jgi:hypothetical protein
MQHQPVVVGDLEAVLADEAEVVVVVEEAVDVEEVGAVEVVEKKKKPGLQSPS